MSRYLTQDKDGKISVEHDWTILLRVQCSEDQAYRIMREIISTHHRDVCDQCLAKDISESAWREED